jgi:hypothetical protein
VSAAISATIKGKLPVLALAFIVGAAVDSARST